MPDMTIDMTTRRLAASELDVLRRRIHGVLLTPDDDGYDEARSLWNGSIDRRPAVIVRAGSTDDVAPAVAFAREHDLPLSVRGGGHNVSGSMIVDELMLHLGGLRAVSVDPVTRHAVVEPGATMVDLDTATVAHGLGVSAAS